MALKIKDNAGTVVKVPSMKEVNDRITTRFQAPGEFKTVNGSVIYGSGNFSLEPAISAGTAGQYWEGTKTWETPDSTPTASSTKLITSGGVYTAIQNIISGSLQFDTTIYDDMGSGNTNAPLTQAVYDDVLAPLNTHIANTTIHVTSTDKTTWNGKQNQINVSGILKGDGTGGVTSAVAGTDYQAPLSSFSANTLNLYNIATNTYGQVTNAVAVTAADIAALGVDITDTTYNLADGGTDGTDGEDGLMSMGDKFKLDNMEDNSQENVIESISIGGVAQTVDSSKNVNLPAYPTVSNATITINSSNTTAQATSPADTFTLNGSATTIDFHRIAKTGNYAHLLNTPDLTVYIEKINPVIAIGNFPAILSDGSLEDSGFSDADFDAAGAAATVQGNLTTHISNTSNPHSTTLSQAAIAQGSALTVVPAAGIYEGTDTSATTKNTKYQTKSEVESIAQAYAQGTAKYLGQLKYGSWDVTDMTAINSFGVVVGDRCGDYTTQIIYEYTAGSPVGPNDVASINPGFYWAALPVTGNEEIGQYYDIVFWFGTWYDGITYGGQVSATMTISDLTNPAAPIWDLIVYSSAMPDGAVTDAKIGNRGPLIDVMAVPAGDYSAKNLTAWLQQFYSNVEYLEDAKADKVAGATAGNFAGLDANGNLVDSGYTDTDFIAASALNAGTLSSSSTVSVPSEKTVYDAIQSVNTSITGSIGNGQLTLTLAPADGSTTSVSNFTANQATASPVSVTIDVPAAYVIGSDFGGDAEQDWTT